MVTIEENDDDSSVGSRQFHPGIGTQDAASALMSFGFGAASGEGKMTPEQVFKQTQEKKHRYYNKLAGDIQGGMSPPTFLLCFTVHLLLFLFDNNPSTTQNKIIRRRRRPHTTT